MTDSACVLMKLAVGVMTSFPQMKSELRRGIRTGAKHLSLIASEEEKKKNAVNDQEENAN